MNLYAIKFEHYSQKDSEVGIVTYLVANNEDEVYEWIKSEPRLEVDTLFNPWSCYEEEKSYDIYDSEYNIVGEESFKERMIRLGGEMYDNEVELNDLYYGKTLYGWELVKENIQDYQITTLMETIGVIVIE